MKNYSLIFTGAVALSVVCAFGFEFYHMRKTRNFKFLQTDLFALFLLSSLFFTVGSVFSMWDTEISGQAYGRKGLWIGFNTVICGVSAYLLYMWYRHKQRGESYSLNTDFQEVTGDSFNALDSEESEVSDIEGNEEGSLEGEEQISEESNKEGDLNLMGNF